MFMPISRAFYWGKKSEGAVQDLYECPHLLLGRRMGHLDEDFWEFELNHQVYDGHDMIHHNHKTTQMLMH